MLANSKTNNRLQEVLALSPGEVSKDRLDGLLNTKEQLRMKHYPALSKERQTGTSDEETDAVFSTSHSAQSTGIAQAIITQNLIFVPAWTHSHKTPLHSLCGMRRGHWWAKARMNRCRDALNDSNKALLSKPASALSGTSWKAQAQQITVTWDYWWCAQTDGHMEHTHVFLLKSRE